MVRASVIVVTASRLASCANAAHRANVMLRTVSFMARFSWGRLSRQRAFVGERTLLSQFNDRGTGAAFLWGSGVVTRDVGVLGQQLRDHLFQNAHAVPVNDAHS